MHLQIRVKAGQRPDGRRNPAVFRLAAQNCLAGPRQFGQIAAVIVLPPEPVIVGGQTSGVGACSMASCSARNLPDPACAAVAQIVQIIADRLIGDDKLNGLPEEASGQQAAESASFAVERFGFNARERLTAQFGIGNPACALFPPV